MDEMDPVYVLHRSRGPERLVRGASAVRVKEGRTLAFLRARILGWMGQPLRLPHAGTSLAQGSTVQPRRREDGEGAGPGTSLLGMGSGR